MECPFDCAAFEKYHAGLPYPEVFVARPNLKYARLVSEAYGGKGSEMTAITQYTFHNFYTEGYPGVFEAYEYITFVETIHLRLLGRLIKLLGLVPLYRNGCTGAFWNGSYPNSGTKMKEMLEADIQGEKDAIAHYTRLIRQIPIDRINILFKRIILDEEKHLSVLLSLYQELASP